MVQHEKQPLYDLVVHAAERAQVQASHYVSSDCDRDGDHGAATRAAMVTVMGAAAAAVEIAFASRWRR